MKPLKINVLLVILSLLVLFDCQAEARYRRKRRTIKILAHGTFQYLYADSEADKLTGATYTKKYDHPYVAAGGLGVLISNNWYIGGRFEHWLAKRDFTLGAVTQQDTLRLQTIGAEIGIFKPINRLFLMFVGGVSYPITLEVQSESAASNTFASSQTPLIFHGKAVFGINFSRYHAFFLEAGYRISNLGKLTSGGTNYVQDGANVFDLDLSGFFGGVGLLLEF